MRVQHLSLSGLRFLARVGARTGWRGTPKPEADVHVGNDKREYRAIGRLDSHLWNPFMERWTSPSSDGPIWRNQVQL